jgi:hypothetical protein
MVATQQESGGNYTGGDEEQHREQRAQSPETQRESREKETRLTLRLQPGSRNLYDEV